VDLTTAYLLEMELLEFQVELCHATFLLSLAAVVVVADTAQVVVLAVFPI
jgi:ATP phosphoribosyltransferase regulatory subunit HisZ